MEVKCIEDIFFTELEVIVNAEIDEISLESLIRLNNDRR